MDDNENKEIITPQSLTPADQDMMKLEGVEIMDQQETPADKTPEIRIEPAAAMPAPKAPIFEQIKEKKGAVFTTAPKAVLGGPDEIKPIRTYRSDAQEAVEKNHTSVIDIAVAEIKKKEQTPIKQKKEPKSRRLLFFSVVLVFIALVVIVGTYYFWIVGSQALQIQSAPNYYSPLIQAQSTQTVPIDPKNPLDSVSKAVLASASAPLGSIVNLIPTGANGLVIATSSAFFSAINIPLPTQVGLSLDGTYMFGAIISNPNHPFIILGVSSFENAFAGMLAWEKSMRTDFGTFIDIDHPTEALIPTNPETFTDATISNQDVREMINASNTPVLLYAFVGTAKLIIATDQSAMSAAIEAVNTTNTTR